MSVLIREKQREIRYREQEVKVEAEVGLLKRWRKRWEWCSHKPRNAAATRIWKRQGRTLT